MLNIPLGFSLFIHLFIQSTKIYRAPAGSQPLGDKHDFCFYEACTCLVDLFHRQDLSLNVSSEGNVPHPLNQAKSLVVCS